jgi:hypothetical protein
MLFHSQRGGFGAGLGGAFMYRRGTMTSIIRVVESTGRCSSVIPVADALDRVVVLRRRDVRELDLVRMAARCVSEMTGVTGVGNTVRVHPG